MVYYARFCHEGDEHVRYTPVADMDAGEPLALGSNYWGVSPTPVAAGEEGTFRVRGVFLAIKADADEAMIVGNLCAFTADVGFAVGAGPWLVREASPAGKATVLLEINPPAFGTGGGGGDPTGQGWTSVANSTARLAQGSLQDGALTLQTNNGLLYAYDSETTSWSVVSLIVQKAALPNPATEEPEVGQVVILANGQMYKFATAAGWELMV